MTAAAGRGLAAAVCPMGTCMHGEPVRFGLAGLGGYAGVMCDRLLAENAAQSPRAHLAAVCEPRLEQFEAKARELTRHGIAVVRSFDELVEQDIEAVMLPVPIDLHRPFTEAALAGGKAVLCEKPAAGCVDDVDAMIAARDRAGLPVAVGFQHAYQPPVLELKRQLLSGELGQPTCCTVIGCWPRGREYYLRNDWAGRFMRNGRWVMDSPASNAMAHAIHLALFLLGPQQLEAAWPLRVQAELYRANRIENYDTCSFRAILTGGVEMLVGCTHACARTVHPEIRIHTDKAEIRCYPSKRIEIHVGGNCRETALPHPEHVAMLEAFGQWVRHGTSAAIAATLESARAHVVLVNAASQAGRIVDVPDRFIQQKTSESSGPVQAIRGIEQAIAAIADQRRMLHETGLAPWSQAGDSLDASRYSHFAGPRGVSLPRLQISTTIPAGKTDTARPLTR